MTKTTKLTQKSLVKILASEYEMMHYICHRAEYIYQRKSKACEQKRIYDALSAAPISDYDKVQHAQVLIDETICYYQLPSPDLCNIPNVCYMPDIKCKTCTYILNDIVSTCLASNPDFVDLKIAKEDPELSCDAPETDEELYKAIDKKPAPKAKKAVKKSSSKSKKSAEVSPLDELLSLLDDPFTAQIPTVDETEQRYSYMYDVVLN